ncbi:MAG: hypothetical protein F2574_02420 [Actinobacteria bacterium]|jgi:hypothetical protein|uniref:Unannotated protein n=1 Tax=freshwater metagenome TaxID=449393 RepID=A0A6J6FSH4_9ZZZZ|nr:hypothetical protein [Actinomycetota bacterium]
MPSAVHVATRLAELNREELVALIEARPWGMGRQLDVHDVADTLLGSDSIDNSLRQLSRVSLEALSAGNGDELSRSLMLSNEDGVPYSEVSPRIPTLSSARMPARPDARIADSSTALHTVVAIRDLISWSYAEPLPMAATGKLLRAEAKLLANGLVIPEAEVETLVWIASQSELVATADRRMRATAAGVELLDDLVGLWKRLSDAVLSQLGVSIADAVRRDGRVDRDYLRWMWAVESPSRDRTIDLVVSAAEMLGLLAGDVTDLGSAWLGGKPAGKPDFPELVSSVYVLDDLSVIAPGPVTSQISDFLDSISRIETRGLAEKRRLDPARILHAVTTGTPAEQILDRLRMMSLTPVSAAVSSTILDIANNTRYVTLNGTGTDTAARVSHPELGAMLVADPRLQRLAPVTIDNSSLLFGAAPDRVETALLDGGYTVVTAQSKSTVSSPTTPSALRIMAEQIHDVGLGTSHMERALIVAGKTRTRVTLTVETGNGTRTMTLEPRNVANGRVRGLDTVADVERTLPISAIITLTTAGDAP